MQGISWEEIFVTHVSDEELVFNVYCRPYASMDSTNLGLKVLRKENSRRFSKAKLTSVACQQLFMSYLQLVTQHLYCIRYYR